MRKFRYVVIDHHGRERSGTVQGPHQEDVRTAFRARMATVKNLWELTPDGELVPCYEKQPRNLTRFWVTLTLLSTLLFSFLLMTRAWPSSGLTTPKPKATQFTLQVTGVLEDGVPGLDLSELKLYGVMPEIFLKQLGELEPESGRFNLSFDFESGELPTELVLEVEHGERRWRVGQKPIDDARPIDFGTILVAAPPEGLRS